jgi:hypothetical protein
MCFARADAFSHAARVVIFCAIDAMTVFAEKNGRFMRKKNVSVTIH